jgi:CRP-like cAMP-binding protein
MFTQFIKTLKLESFSYKSFIFHKGDPGTCFYIILQGFVKLKVRKNVLVSVDHPDAFKTVAMLGPGEGFGDQAIITDSDRSASAMSVSQPVYLARIDKSEYKRAMLLSECFILINFKV